MKGSEISQQLGRQAAAAERAAPARAHVAHVPGAERLGVHAHGDAVAEAKRVGLRLLRRRLWRRLGAFLGALFLF